MTAQEILEKISALRKNDFKSLAELDANGLLLGPKENLTEFKKRTKQLFNHLLKFEKELRKNEKVTVFDTITVSDNWRINSEIMKEAAELDKKFYEFQISWVPGFFLSKSLGWLWGGCAISFPEDSMSIFLIRESFAEKQKWLFYHRDELLAHELCHIARLPINDRTYEEHFAYRLSYSALRRYIGNCFQYTFDAVFFIIPFFMLLGAQTLKTFSPWEWFPIYPFWILIVLYPAFLLVRNQRSRNIYFKAKKNLERIGMQHSMPVLFRCTKDEIHTIAAFTKDILGLKEWLGKQSCLHLRWRIIYERFMSEDKNLHDKFEDTRASKTPND